MDVIQKRDMTATGMTAAAFSVPGRLPTDTHLSLEYTAAPKAKSEMPKVDSRN